MKYKDFEDYLQWKHAEQYHGLDDDMPDDYNSWLDNLDQEELIEYGNKFAAQFLAQYVEELKKTPKNFGDFPEEK